MGEDLLLPPHPTPRGVSQHPAGSYGAGCTGRVPPRSQELMVWVHPRQWGSHGVGAHVCPYSPSRPRGLGGCSCFVPPTPQHPTQGRCPFLPGQQGPMGLGVCVVSPPKLQGGMNLEGQVPPAPQTAGSEGGCTALPFRGSNRAGVQVLCVTPPKSQGPMELGVHDFPCPKLNGPTGWVHTPGCVSLAPSPPQQTQLLLHWGVRLGSHPPAQGGGARLPRQGRFRGGVAYKRPHCSRH